MDECGFQPIAVKKIYFPLTSQKGVAIVMFSTPDSKDSGSWFNEFLEEKQDEILTEVYDLVCEACKKKDVYEWKYCEHSKFEGSLLKDVGTDNLSGMMSKEDLANEVYGNALDKDNYAFVKDHITWAFSKENWIDLKVNQCNFNFWYWDPNFGGPNQSAGVEMHSLQNSSIQVMGWLSSLSTKNPEDAKAFFRDNIAEYRLHTKSYDIPLIIAYETVSNYSAYEAEAYIKELAVKDKKFKNIFFVYEPNWIGTQRERPGVNLYGDRKDKFVKDFRSCIAERNLRIEKDVNTYGNGTVSEVLKQLEKECGMFRGKDILMALERRKNRDKMENKFNCGKMMIGNFVINDDLIVALLGCRFTKELFTYDPSCKSQRMKINSAMRKQIFEY